MNDGNPDARRAEIDSRHDGHSGNSHRRLVFGTAQYSHPHAERLRQGNHFLEYISISYSNVVALIMSHQRIFPNPEIRRHQRPLACCAVPTLIPDRGRQAHHFAAADVGPELIRFDVSARPGDGTRQALAGKRSSRNGEISCRLSVAMDPSQSLGVVIKGVGTT